jgi:hypothetical protein
MESRNLLARVGIVVLCVLFVGGLVRLNQISLTSSYPPFSSLRSDGEGSKLLWEGLAGTGKVHEHRSYQPLEETHFTGCSVFYLGLRPYEFAHVDEAFLQTVERIAGGGNRLVLGFTDDPLDEDEKGKNKSPADKRWNVRFVQSKKKEDTVVSVDARAPWQPLLIAGSPVAFERAFSTGTVVLLPHVSRISNAALAKDERSRQLIPALIGNNSTVIFDEAHLGIAESGSIAGLARKYRLGGFLAGFLILAGAFLWNRSVVFPPIPTDDKNDNTQPIAGNDTRSTLVNLLSRHIPPDDLIKICIAEWNRTHPDKKLAEDGGTALKDPVLLYQNIQETLQNEKTLKL